MQTETSKFWDQMNEHGEAQCLGTCPSETGEYLEDLGFERVAGHEGYWRNDGSFYVEEEGTGKLLFVCGSEEAWRDYLNH